jgi:predicted transcriptional regulator
MDTAQQNPTEKLIELTADVVTAYVSNNAVPADQISGLISSVHASLSGIVAPPKAPAQEKPTPSVPIKKSVTPDYLISLEDGRRYKSLKRHLTGRGLTPQQYREKWGLPVDYPMVAPNYAKRRSELAKAAGLGQQRRKPAGEAGAGKAAKGRPRKKAA